MSVSIALPTLRELSVSDLYTITAIHMDAFPGSAMTKLGPQAVNRYYHWLFTGPHDLYAVGVQLKRELVGFSFGGVFHGATTGFLQHNKTLLARLLILKPWLITNPIFLDRLMIAWRLLKPFKKESKKVQGSNSDSKPRVRSFGILAIAVSPSCQGSGFGRLMLENSEFYARQNNFPHMHLTVNETNTQAIRFYEKQGWSRMYRDGKWSGGMEKNLE